MTRGYHLGAVLEQRVAYPIDKIIIGLLQVQPAEQAMKVGSGCFETLVQTVMQSRMGASADEE